MIVQAIDSVTIAVADLDGAGQPYERLGLRVGAAEGGRRTLRVGGRDNGVAVHFMGDGDPTGPMTEPRSKALASERPLFALGLRVEDLVHALEELRQRGISTSQRKHGGSDLAWVSLHDRAGADLILVQNGPSVLHPLAHEEHPGLQNTPLRLKRLDHLAVVAHDLEAKSRFWSDVLGVPVAGEVTTPTLIIRQLKVGDAVVELLGAASLDSPLVKRPAGLVSMASWEVADLDEEFRRARAVGFTGTEPAAGPLPGTRIATLSGPELAGVNMQLLQYV